MDGGSFLNAEGELHSGYTVYNVGGCRLIRGAVPIQDFVGLTRGLPRSAVMSCRLAELMGMSFAFGSPKDVERLLKDEEVLAAARDRSLAELQGLDLPPEAVEWWATGERGASSEALFARLSGAKLGSVRDPDAYPHDPADFRRCRLLLEAVPAFRGRLEEMSGVSAVWGRLVARWDELCATMDEECPGWRREGGEAPRTFRLLETLTR